ncbi:MAG: sulfite exporter TauE/SafE family protein [Thermoplasmatota archaeon]
MDPRAEACTILSLPGPSVDGINAFVLIFLGFVVGVLGGFFGVGGTWLVTPSLNLLGLPITWAVGTDLLHAMGKGLLAAFRHHRFGNVDFRMAGIMVIGSVAGIQVGGTALLWLDARGLATDVVQGLYIVVLLIIGVRVLLDYRRAAIAHDWTERPSKMANRLTGLRIPPRIDFPVSGLRGVSIWAPIILGFVSGIFSGLLGVGAGFIRMPSLVYFLAVPTKVAVGTDLFEVVFSAGYGGLFYAAEGRVFLAVAAVMLLGAAVGAQLGAFATLYVKSLRIRLYFGLSVLGPALALIVKQIGKRVHWAPTDVVAVVILFASAVLICFAILRAFVRGWIEENYWRDLDLKAGSALRSLTSAEGKAVPDRSTPLSEPLEGLEERKRGGRSGGRRPAT